MHKYKQFLVWQKSRTLTKEVYMISMDFPCVEDFNLTAQIRRASTSIMLKISEGAGRFSNPNFARFFTIASGSANEVGRAAIIAFDQGYIEEPTVNSVENQVEEILKMLFKLRKSLAKSS